MIFDGLCLTSTTPHGRYCDPMSLGAGKDTTRRTASPGTVLRFNFPFPPKLQTSPSYCLQFLPTMKSLRMERRLVVSVGCRRSVVCASARRFSIISHPYLQEHPP